MSRMIPSEIKLETKVILTAAGLDYYLAGNALTKRIAYNYQYGVISQINKTKFKVIWFDQYHQKVVARCTKFYPYNGLLQIYDEKKPTRQVFDIEETLKNLDKIEYELKSGGSSMDE